MRADDIAKTLIDIQCDIYKRHSATSAPTDRAEYEQWVAEATDAVTQLYGNVDMGRYGLALGRACQMATDMNAHIAAEALERSLCQDDDDDGNGVSDEVDQLDDICDEILALADERASLSCAIAGGIQHVVDVVGDAMAQEGATLSGDKVDATGRNGLVANGTMGMKVPECMEFGVSRPNGFVVRHRLTADEDMVSVFWKDEGIVLSACSRDLLGMSDTAIREEFRMTA